MYETGYVLPAWGKGRLAQGYADGERWGTVLERPLAADGPYWVLRANGGIHSTAYDMLRWAQALVAGRVLKPESMQQCWAPHVRGGVDTHYGYGWVVTEMAGVQAVTHSGSNGIFFADLAIVPSAGLVIFLQTNVFSESRMAGHLLGQLRSRMVAGKPFPDVPDVANDGMANHGRPQRGKRQVPVSVAALLLVLGVASGAALTRARSRLSG